VSRSLNRYLRFAVLGDTTKPARRAPRRRAARRGPARDWKYRAFVRSLPCAACGSSYQVEAAHTGSDGGMRQKASDYSCIPLCHEEHQAAPDSYHRIDGGREAFARSRGLDIDEIVSRLNAAYRGVAEYARGQE
jgi:hypothetical protein